MRSYTFILLFFLALRCIGQNLVPDPGFNIRTTIDSCYSPLDTGISNANLLSFYRTPKILHHWSSPTYATSGIINSSCSGAFINLNPQTPLSGNNIGYIRIYNYANNPAFPSTFANSRSYLQTELKDSLKKGVSYHLSFYVSYTLYTQNTSPYKEYATSSSIGAHFSNQRITKFNVQPRDDSTVLNYTPHIVNHPDSFSTDTSKWYEICGTYIAKGGEKWLTLGNFYDDANTLLNTFRQAQPNSAIHVTSHYYVDSVTVEEIKLIEAETNSRDTLICSNQVIVDTLRAKKGAISYLWNDSSTADTLIVNGFGTYWLKADFGCGIAVDTFRILPYTAADLNLGADTTLCENVDSVLISASPNFEKYKWSTGDTLENLWVNQSGIYFLEAIYPCDTLRDTIEVSFIKKADPPSIVDTGFCVNSTINISLPPTTIVWYDSLNDLIPSQIKPFQDVSFENSQQYYISQIVDGCESDKSTFHVKVQDSVEFNLGNDTTLCGLSMFELSSPLKQWNYRWSTDDIANNITVNVSDQYWLSASNYCNVFADTIEVNFENMPPPPDASNSSFCDSSYITADSFKIIGQNLRWYESFNDSIGSNVPDIKQDSGEYQYYVTQQIEGCESKKSTFSISIKSKPKLKLTDTLSECLGQQLKIDASTNASYYLWNTSDTIPKIIIDSSGIYSVIASNECGRVIDSVTVHLMDCTTRIIIPNVFTPNKDGINDYLRTKGANFKILNWTIYNRFGQKIYESASDWNGRINGNLCEEGNYYYVLNYIDYFNQEQTVKGTVSLIR